MNADIKAKIASCNFPLTAEAVMKLCIYISQAGMDQVSEQAITQHTKLESSFVKIILDFLSSRNLIQKMQGDGVDSRGQKIILYHITEHGRQNGERVLLYELSQWSDNH